MTYIRHINSILDDLIAYQAFEIVYQALKFNIIVAVDINNGIGLHNNIPWLDKYSDLAYFKKITKQNKLKR